MSTDLNALWDAISRGDRRAMAKEMFSSAIPADPQQPMPGTPALVERSALPPCADTGTAGVSDLRLNPTYERFVAKLYTMLRDDRIDEAYDLVRAEHRAIHGPAA